MMNQTAEDRLVARTSDLIDQYSAEQHELARRVDALRHARTQLRLGSPAAVVLALLKQETGEDLDAMCGREMDRLSFAIQTGRSSIPPASAVKRVRMSLALSR
jgi:hypothetical protein